MEVFYLIICGIVLKLICRSIMVEGLIDKSGRFQKSSESLQTFLTYDSKFSMRIQITEDEHEVADFVKKALTEEKHAVDIANDGLEGEDQALSESYDLVILDIILPKKRTGGFEIVARRRPGDAGFNAHRSR